MNDLEDDLNVDLTPLIDVTFMLVIFFIMTMSFTTPVIDIILPSSTTSEVTKKNNLINVTINKQGDIFIDEQIYTLDKVISYIETKENVTINLFIDKEASSQHLIDMADIARKYAQGRLVINTNKVNP